MRVTALAQPLVQGPLHGHEVDSKVMADFVPVLFNWYSGDRSRSPSPPRDRAPLPSTISISEERLNSLSSQLEISLEMSRTLQTPHSTAQSTIAMLEAKVNALESLVQATQTQVLTHTSEVPQECSSLTALVTEWKKTAEGQ
jgi:hypothetical protein